jgi:hypothetical protein
MPVPITEKKLETLGEQAKPISISRFAGKCCYAILAPLAP